MEACRRLNRATGTDGDLLEIWRDVIIFNFFSVPFFVFVLRRWPLRHLWSCYSVLHVPDNELRGRGPLRTLLSEPAWLGLDLWASMVWCYHMSPTFYSTRIHVHCHLEMLNRMSIDTSWDTSKQPFICRLFRVLPYLSGAKESCTICNLPLGYVTECRCALAQEPRR